MKNNQFFEFSQADIDRDKKRLCSQVWKLLPMREKGEDWETHLSVVIEEICGLSKILNKDYPFLILLSKLHGLKDPSCKEFSLYRKTVFKCIDLLSKV